MAAKADPTFANDLQTCFNELKKHSVSYKLGQAQQTAGDEQQNPLQAQFSSLLTKLEENLGQHNKHSPEYTKIISMKASIIYEKAKILLSENLLLESQTLLEEALEVIAEYSEHPQMAFLHMRIINHLTYVLCCLGHLQEAKELLIREIENNGKSSPEVFSTDDLFQDIKKDPIISSSKLNRLYINNMQMLAWIYARLGEIEQNLKMQHDILQRQLDATNDDALTWAQSCFRLGGIFVIYGDWPNAKYHLTVAENILNPLEVALLPNPEVHMAQADLARSWIHYGLQLFEASRNQKISKSIEDDIENEIRSNEKLPSNSEILEFSGLNVEIPTNVPDTPIHNLEQAKQLFSHLQKMIKRARLYYTLRDYPLEYVNLCLDLSELYRFLAFYEEDLDSQYAVQKRRYDALETLSNILKEVRPNCYIAVNVELIKELIEVQIELMNLNLKKFYSPSQVPKNDINDGVLKRHIKAFSVIHNKLQNVTSVLNTSTSSEQIKGLKFKEPNLEKLVDEEKVKN